MDWISSISAANLRAIARAGSSAFRRFRTVTVYGISTLLILPVEMLSFRALRLRPCQSGALTN